MTRAGTLVRVSRLSGERKRLLLQATLLLGLASAAVALLPFRRAIRFGSVPLARRRPQSVEGIVWAVKAAARRMPWRNACIEQGLAAQRMLRRGGNDAVLHYGARHAKSGKLEAHVWVSIAGEAVIGGEEAAGFAEISTFS
jgi:transglutaminase superfamily protein